ncbi:MAG: putative oxidoreductase [Sphingomonadales bacterium]|nr:putative oxidoreductase [Sphingomonadales bacterium]
MSEKIRVGIIGMQPDRSWGAIAHIPALAALSNDYVVTALSTTRQESADAAAARYGVPHAFDNHHALVTSPDVDLVAVTVKVPHHLELVTAAIEAGKHVYCEWPLGNGIAEARQMAALAKSKGVKAAIGLQARQAPVLRYVADLIGQGFIGDVLSTSLIGTGMNWGEYVDRPNAYTADKANGATVLTIPVSHTMDAVCNILGEVESLVAIAVNRRKHTILVETGEALPLTSEDQIVFAGTLSGGVVASLHYRGGMSKGPGLIWEINGSKGDLRLGAYGGHIQLLDLTLEGAGADDQQLKPLSVPDHYYSTAIRDGVALNVAEVYARFASDIRDGTSRCATFDDAVVRHQMVEAIERSAQTGNRVSPSDC